ncbi:CASP C terminal-domain-containing protein [Aspergillus lucknowensis]|uniref:Protein CASP n=1 Tax=Aspergillus lucknowensis TaxID=176173 RepID=A0ABR4L8Z5_9EURO
MSRQQFDVSEGNIQAQGKFENSNFYQYVRDQDRQSRDRCLDYFAMTDPRDVKIAIHQTRGAALKESYEWILCHSQYLCWRDRNDSQVLWVKGDPGKGKTMLLCGIINELRPTTKLADSQAETLLSFFFCQATVPKLSNAQAVLRGLIYMLVDTQPSLLSHVQKRFRDAGEPQFGDAEAWTALCNMFLDILREASSDKIYIVVDALDECVQGQDKLLQFILQGTKEFPHVKWIISSRNHIEQRTRLDDSQSILSLELQENAESVSVAIGPYISNKISKLESLQNEDTLQKYVQRALQEKAEGTFLWVAFVVQELEGVDRWKDRIDERVGGNEVEGKNRWTLAITEGVAPQADTQNGHASEAGPGNTLSEGANKFQRAIAAWRGIDLSNTLAKLDITASDIVADQRDALVQRKDLAQKTKDFRKLDDAGKLAEYKSLLKAYQGFIDLLTNQGKSSSSAFLQLYSSLSEAPDPYPLLETSVDSLVLAEEIVPKLTSERDQCLTSQLEETEQRLQEERAARKKLEENQDSKTKEIEASWSAVLTEKTNNWTAKEKSLEEKVENQDRLIKDLKANYENDGGGNQSQHGASAAELELVSTELEKTSLRLTEMEARNEQLTLELAQAVSHSKEVQSTSIDDDPAYLRLQSENSSLLRKLDAARFDRESELEKVADYEEIRRELEMIESIEFSSGDDEDAGDIPDGANGSVTKAKEGGKNSSLEQLLLGRNKKLTDELTVLRVSHRDLQGQLETLRDDLLTTRGELEKSQNLSTTLENDLLRLQTEAANAFPPSALSLAGTYASKYPHSSRRGAVSPTSSIISGFDQSAMSNSTMEAIRAGEPVGGGSGLLPMTQAQRDRFKKKNAELEEELSKLYSTVKALRQEVASLQKDDLSLYEKTRYVSTYSRCQGALTSASSYANTPSSSSIHPSADTLSGLSVDRYQSAYEAQISPFAAFRGRESTRAYKQMSLPERVVFSLTRIILANRTSRNLFAGYCFALHILLFTMLYMMSSMEIERHGSASLGAATAASLNGGAGSGNSYSGQLHGDDWQQEGFNHAG